MHKETVYDILLDYLEQRKSAQLNSKSISERLKKMGKSEQEIHEILIEFDDEWDRERLHQHGLKNAKLHLIGGAVLAISVGIISILSAMNILWFARIPVIWYGGVAIGFLLVMRGWNKLKSTKIRDERLKIKYRNW